MTEQEKKTYTIVRLCIGSKCKKKKVSSEVPPARVRLMAEVSLALVLDDEKVLVSIPVEIRELDDVGLDLSKIPVNAKLYRMEEKLKETKNLGG